jgi:hypothetical protein
VVTLQFELIFDCFGGVVDNAEQLMINFVFLIEYFDGKIIIFAKLLGGKLNFFEHAEVHYDCSCLPTTLLFRS